MNESSFVDPELLKRVRIGRDYVAAKYGFPESLVPGAARIGASPRTNRFP